MTSMYFIFNKVIYKQTFGMPMGSLSPIIADIVLQDLEEKALNTPKVFIIVTILLSLCGWHSIRY